MQSVSGFSRTTGGWSRSIVRIAYQGEPGAFSEAASRQVAADAELVPCKSFEDVFAAVDGGDGRLRRAADRELDRRQHPPQLRPAARARPADRRRGRGAGRPPPAGAAGRDAGAGAADLLASAGAGAVRSVSADADGRRDHRDLRHGRQRQDDRRPSGSTDAAAIASARAGEVFGLVPLQVVDSGLRAQHDALPGRRPPSAVERAARQDDASCSRCRTSRARCSRR